MAAMSQPPISLSVSGKQGHVEPSCTQHLHVPCSTLTSIPIGGQLLSTDDGSYQGLIVFAGVSYVGALSCYIASRVIAVGWNPKTFF